MYNDDNTGVTLGQLVGWTTVFIVCLIVFIR